MVSGAQPGSQAASAGVTGGHALKAVQGRPVIGLSFNQTVEAIRAAGRPVALVLGPAPMAVPDPPLYFLFRRLYFSLENIGCFPPSSTLDRLLVVHARKQKVHCNNNNKIL